jgi:hypothetical protein
VAEATKVARPLEDLTSGQRRRLIASALARALATSSLVVTGYYLLPLDRTSDAASLAILALGFVALIGIMAWQVRSIVASPYPAIRATESLAATTPLLLVIFASTYYLMERDAASNFTQTMSRTDALYFTVTTFSTTGFGDITPRTEIARLVVTGQMVVDLLILGFGVKVFVGAVRMGQQRSRG